MNEQNEQGVRVVTLTVDRVDDDGSRERGGVFRHKTYAFIPELNINKYSTVLWVQGDRPTKGATLRATIRQGGIRSSQDGTQKTGQYPSDYYWEVVEWDVGGAATSPQPASSQSTGGAAFVAPPNDIDRRRAEDAIAFRRRDALNAAVDFLKTAGASSPIQALEFADTFFAWLNQRPEPDTQAPEPPAEQRIEPEGTKPPGKIVSLPNQITVPEMMDDSEFKASARTAGWTAKNVRAILGMSATQWTEENNSDQDYRPAWDFCVNAWQNAQEPVEEISW